MHPECPRRVMIRLQTADIWDGPVSILKSSSVLSFPTMLNVIESAINITTKNFSIPAKLICCSCHCNSPFMPHYFIYRRSTCWLTFREKDYVLLNFVRARRKNVEHVINLTQTWEWWTTKTENKHGKGLSQQEECQNTGSGVAKEGFVHSIELRCSIYHFK